MTKETIKQIILKADEGMYLTNGETYGKTVVLPEGASVNDWHEINEEEYEKIMAEENPAPEIM
jgi:hypothetical protein